MGNPGNLLHRIDQSFEVRYRYPVCFTRAAFAQHNTLIRDLLVSDLAPGMHKARVLCAVDSGLARANPGLVEEVESYAGAHQDAIDLVRAPWVVRGGEISKSDPVQVSELYEHTRSFGLCRHSYLLAVGGGAMLDAIGYAAATAHRGLRLLRMPSTVLAQNDAGIGVKNAINWQGRKNFLGTFVPPFAVINDLDLPATMPRGEQRDGIAEAIKVALIRDREFFELMHRQRQALAAHEPGAVEQMTIRCAELHLAHIRTSGDPFENGSARPLDFGHWSAHKLEELSGNELRHGAAVAIGVALDSLYSHAVGMLDEESLAKIFRTLRDTGFALDHPVLEQLDVARALSDFREHLGGSLCITLLEGIGKSVEVDHIDVAIMHRCIAQLRCSDQPALANAV